jgi:two-component system NtrC family response regulator
MGYKLRIKRDRKPVKEVVIKGNSASLGRGPECDIHLDQNMVSQMHANLFIKPQGVLLVDLDSTNGTYVGQRQADRIMLQHGDTFQIGDFHLTLEITKTKSGTGYQSDSGQNITLKQKFLPGGALMDQEITKALFAWSPPMQKVMALIKKAADTEIPILITGETGTGKGFLALMIHELSRRKNGPFQTVDCSTIPKDLMESELFGHEKGAFTGAINKKLGKVQLAHLGTLFLDEIGDLPLEIQSKLLRFLEEKRFERVGGTHTIEIETRVLVATNKDLEKEVKNKNFRSDLLFRINAFHINVPTLQHRQQDIMPLANHFLSVESRQVGRTSMRFSDHVQTRLLKHGWPGNIRELLNRVTRAIVLTSGDIVTSEAMGFIEGTDEDLEKSKYFVNLHEAREWIDRKCISQAIEKYRNNISKAAQELGIARITLRELMKKYDIRKD